MYTGLLIVLEGFDGVGKTTQVKKLLDFLNSSGHETVSFREPGGTEVGNAIRNILIEHGSSLPTEALVNLLIASKKVLLEEKILPALYSGKNVILDRYTASMMAYQCTADGNVTPDSIREILKASNIDTEPDIYIYLDASPDTIIQRLSNRNGDVADDFEEFHLRKMAEIQRNYRHYFAKTCNSSVAEVSADRDVESVFEGIKSELIRHFPNLGSCSDDSPIN